ncbi:MAG: NAD-dependent epimerase/dehydratase family protein [Actinomycetota bacterium]
MTGPVFVTGGTGLVGGPIVGRLVAQGRRVVALSRSEHGDAMLSARGAEPVRGDLFDRERLIDAMRGCEVVYHVAGLNSFCLRDPSPLFRVNVDGALSVVIGAAAAGVRRLVLTSSAATLGEPPGSVGSEVSPHRGWFLSAYERSKYEGELAVFAEGGKAGMEVVSVNPSSVQGPGRATGSARLLIEYLNGTLKVAVDSRISVVDIDDCADGHLLAEEHGRPGQRYVLSGASVTVGEALELLGRLTGLVGGPRMLPPRLALAAATVAEAGARITGRSTHLCRESVRTILHGHRYDGLRAERELGLHYRSLGETLRRTVAWYVREGIVTRAMPAFEG